MPPEDELKALASAAAAEGNRDRSIGSEGKLSGVVIHLDRVKRKQKEVMDDDQCAAQARVWKIIPED